MLYIAASAEGHQEGIRPHVHHVHDHAEIFYFYFLEFLKTGFPLTVILNKYIYIFI